jgi:threonine/homoserine/homoserine lactone efflux protein
MGLALVSFAFVTSITPGPNNIMLTASGVNFGFARTLPHMSGICVGFTALVLGVGVGIGAVFAAAPVLQTALKVIGAAYMLWLAWRVATAGGSPEHADERGRPLTFWEAAAFQWVNPKAWVMAIGAMALYVRPDHSAFDIGVVTLVFGLMCVAAVGVWTAFGHALRNVLRDPVKVRAFNIAMALLLVASILPIVIN